MLDGDGEASAAGASRTSDKSLPERSEAASLATEISSTGEWYPLDIGMEVVVSIFPDGDELPAIRR